MLSWSFFQKNVWQLQNVMNPKTLFFEARTATLYFRSILVHIQAVTEHFGRRPACERLLPASRFLAGVAILCITEEGLGEKWRSFVGDRIGIDTERRRRGGKGFIDLRRKSVLLVPCDAKIAITSASSWGAGQASRQVWKACWCSGQSWIGKSIICTTFLQGITCF